MQIEIEELLKFSRGETVIKKFEVFDLNRSTTFSLSTVSWDLYRRKDGVSIDSGSGIVNNDDTDRAGNTIKTAEVSIDLDLTDQLELGSYYLVVQPTLTTNQSRPFRFPVEIVDVRTKGIS